MKSKKWLWILTTILVIAVIVITAICMTRCSNDDSSKTLTLTKNESITNYKSYEAEVKDGKSGLTYKFKSLASEHQYSVIVAQAEGEGLLDSSKYELKMYNKNNEEIAMTYDSTTYIVTLASDATAKWPSVYASEDVYFAITLKDNVSFKLVLQQTMA